MQESTITNDKGGESSAAAAAAAADVMTMEDDDDGGEGGGRGAEQNDEITSLLLKHERKSTNQSGGFPPGGGGGRGGGGSDTGSDESEPDEPVSLDPFGNVVDPRSAADHLASSSSSFPPDPILGGIGVDDNATFGVGAAADDVEEMSGDDDDDGDIPMVRVGEEEITLTDVNEDIIARMTAEEKEKYSQVYQDFYAHMYD